MGALIGPFWQMSLQSSASRHCQHSKSRTEFVIKPQEVLKQVLQYAQQLHNFEVDLDRPIIKQLLDSLILYHLKRRNEALHRGRATAKANGYQELKYGNELMRVDGY
jgi:hypothetical protein